MRKIKILTICFCIFAANADTNTTEESPSLLSRIKNSISNIFSSKKDKPAEPSVAVKEEESLSEPTENKEESAPAEEPAQGEQKPTDEVSSTEGSNEIPSESTNEAPSESSNVPPSEDDVKKAEATADAVADQVVTEESAIEDKEDKKDENSNAAQSTSETEEQ